MAGWETRRFCVLITTPAKSAVGKISCKLEKKEMKEKKNGRYVFL